MPLSFVGNWTTLVFERRAENGDLDSGERRGKKLPNLSDYNKVF